MATSARRAAPPSPARRHRSFRFDPETLRRLEERAGESEQTQTALVERYVEEGLRLDRHPGIVFVSGAAGRRPRLAGTRLDIGQVIETLQSELNSIQAAAAYFGIPESQVWTAARYYAEHRDEVDSWNERMRAISDREEAASRRLRDALA
jgi:uncharacterized protein (DUF433 family)